MLVGAAASPPAAFAHATLLRTDPPTQSVVARAPAKIVLHFSQAVTPVSGGTDVIGPTGASFVSGAVAPSPTDVRALVIPLATGLPNGDYTVRWRVASTDGHLISGVFAIGVGAGRPPPQLVTAQGSAVDSGYLVARFLYFIGLFVLLGGALARLVVLRPAIRSVEGEARAEVDESEWTGFAVLAFAAVVLVVIGGWAAVVRQATQVAGISFWAPLTGNGPLVAPIGETRFGREFGHGIEAAMAFFALLLCAYAVRRWRPLLYAVGAAAAAVAVWALVGPGLAGHAGDPGRGRLAVAVDAVHLAAAAVWIGGLAHLFVVVAPATASLAPELRRRVRLEVAQRFSRLALASVAVIGATGLGRALWELGAVSQVWSTAYGRTLLIKSALLAGLVLLGYRNRKTLAQFAALRRRVGVELALLVTMTAAVSLLTDLAPGNETASAARAAAPPAARRVVVVPLGRAARLELWPGRAGGNAVAVRFRGPERPPRAQLILQPQGGEGATVALSRLRSGDYAGVVPPVAAGDVSAQVALGGRAWAATFRLQPGGASSTAAATRVTARRVAAGRVRLSVADGNGTAVADALVTSARRLATPCRTRAGCYDLASAGPRKTLRVEVQRPGRPPTSATVPIRR